MFYEKESVEFYDLLFRCTADFMKNNSTLPNKELFIIIWTVQCSLMETTLSEMVKTKKEAMSYLDKTVTMLENGINKHFGHEKKSNHMKRTKKLATEVQECINKFMRNNKSIPNKQNFQSIYTVLFAAFETSMKIILNDEHEALIYIDFLTEQLKNWHREKYTIKH
jgi:hypothetical protein